MSRRRRSRHELLDVPSPKGRNVLIKPNLFLATSRPNGTHNDTLRQVVLEVKARGASRVAVGGRSGPSSTKTIIEMKRLPAMAQELGFALVNFEDLPANGWVHFDPRANHWRNGFGVARPVAEAEYLVWVCCLKAHTEAAFSMSLKHGVGAVHRDLMAELHGAEQTDMHLMIAEINQAFRPQVIVMDGVEVFVDGGPARGTLATAGVLSGERTGSPWMRSVSRSSSIWAQPRRSCPKGSSSRPRSAARSNWAWASGSRPRSICDRRCRESRVRGHPSKNSGPGLIRSDAPGFWIHPEG